MTFMRTTFFLTAEKSLTPDDSDCCGFHDHWTFFPSGTSK
jgi:hypothetical protein